MDSSLMESSASPTTHDGFFSAGPGSPSERTRRDEEEWEEGVGDTAGGGRDGTGQSVRWDGVCIVCYMYRGQGERAALPLVEGERPEGAKGLWHGPDGRRWKLLMRTWPVVESCETFRPRGPPWQTMTISFRRLFGRLTRSFDFFDFPILLKTRVPNPKSSLAVLRRKMVITHL